MTLAFHDRVALLEQHGQAAIDAFGALPPQAPVPPRGSSCRELGLDHWGTVEIWAWSLEHPDRNWRDREEPSEPEDHRALVSEIALRHRRVVASLRAAGPDHPVDYFDRPGTTGDVARLLAHAAIETAHAAGVAAGQPAPGVTAETACDGVDHLLDHWAGPSQGVRWRPQAVSIRSTSPAAEWCIDVPASGDDFGAFRRTATTATPSAVVQGAPTDLLWWLHGYPSVVDVNPPGSASPSGGRLLITGGEDDVRALHHALALPAPKATRRRWRWRG